MSQLPPSTTPRAGNVRLAAALAAIAVIGLGVVVAPRLWRSSSPEEPPRIAHPGSSSAAPAEPALEPTAALQEPGPAVDRRRRRPVEGLVLDAGSGEPIQSFVLSTLPSPKPSKASAWQEAGTYDTSSPNGEWEMPILPDGSYTLRFAAPGYEDALVENVANPAPVGPPLEVRMERGRWVHGTLRDKQGKPIPGFAMRLVPDQASATEALSQLEVQTDPSGAYSFPVVPAGRWHAQVAGLEGIVREPLVSETWTLEQPGEVVWDPEVPQLTNVQLAVKWDAKRFVMARIDAVLTSPWGSKQAVTLHNDKGTFERVAPGTYELVIGKPGVEPWHREMIEVPASATPIEWARTITPPERTKPEVNVQRPGRKKNGGQRGAAVETSASGQRSVSAHQGTPGAAGKPGALKNKKKKQGG